MLQTFYTAFSRVFMMYLDRYRWLVLTNCSFITMRKKSDVFIDVTV